MARVKSARSSHRHLLTQQTINYVSCSIAENGADNGATVNWCPHVFSVLLFWARHHDASLSGLCALGDGMVTDVSFQVIPISQSLVSKPRFLEHEWRAFARSQDKLGTDVSTRFGRADGAQTDTFDGRDHSRRLVSSKVLREQSEELGFLDFGGDEKEEALGMLMSGTKEQEQEFTDQLKSGRLPSIRRRPETGNGWHSRDRLQPPFGARTQ